MKILYIVQWFSPPDKPSLSRAYQFAKAWVTAGHQVHIITSFLDHLSFSPNIDEINNPLVGITKVDGIDVIRVWSFPSGRRGQGQRIRLYCSFMLSGYLASLSSSSPDLVIASSPPTTAGLLGFEIARRCRVPFVYELRELWPDKLLAAGQINNGVLSRIVQRMERVCLKGADAIVVVTEGDKLSLLKEGLPESRILVIPHGVDNWMAEPLRPAPKTRDGYFNCLYAGALGPFNRAKDILDVAHILAGDRTFFFLIFGDGDEKRKLKRKAAQMGLKDLIFRPITGKKEIFSEMTKADACILTSGEHPQYAQWLPNKVFDYMASGTPVVASAKGEMADLINAGGGTVVEPGDPRNLVNGLVSLANASTFKRNAMGLKARLHVLKYYLRNHQAERLLELFDKLVRS